MHNLTLSPAAPLHTLNSQPGRRLYFQSGSKHTAQEATHLMEAHNAMARFCFMFVGAVAGAISFGVRGGLPSLVAGMATLVLTISACLALGLALYFSSPVRHRNTCLNIMAGVYALAGTALVAELHLLVRVVIKNDAASGWWRRAGVASFILGPVLLALTWNVATALAARRARATLGEAFGLDERSCASKGSALSALSEGEFENRASGGSGGDIECVAGGRGWGGGPKV